MAVFFERANMTAGRSAPSHSTVPGSAIQRPSGLIHVSRDLRRELGRAREGDLVSEPLHEGGLDLFAVDLAAKVQKKGLEHPLATAEGRADPERGRRLETSLSHLGPHRVDAVAWEEALAREGEVDRRESEGAPAPLAVHHLAAD